MFQEFFHRDDATDFINDVGMYVMLNCETVAGMAKSLNYHIPSWKWKYEKGFTWQRLFRW